MRISDWSSDVCSSDLEHPADDDGDALAQLLRGLVPLVAGCSRAVCQKHLTHEPRPGAGLESPAPDCRLHLYSPSGCSLARRFSNALPLVITQEDRKSKRLNSSH